MNDSSTIKRSTFTSIIRVIISNIISIISGVIVAFVLPKIMPVIDYGWYKTFTLYISYVGFCSLGIIDGIVLKYGNYDYEDINKKLFRSYFRWYFLIHFGFGIVILFVSLFYRDENIRIISSFLVFDMFAVNFTGYFQQLSQITMRFREFSSRKILQSISNVVIVILFYILFRNGYEVHYYSYLTLFVLFNLLLTAWYLYTYRELVFGETLGIWNVLHDVISLSRIGFPLLFSNLSTTLILSIDKQFVNLFFSTELYAIYAFAYNMLTIITVATSAIAVVLYPTMKRTDEETLKNNYSELVSIITIFVYAAISIYYPLSAFVKWYLPNYYDSLVIFRIVFPSLAFTSVITVVMHNYYKAFGRSDIFFRKSIIVLLLSAILDVICYLLFKSMVAISVASVVSVIIWYLFIDQYFVTVYGYHREKTFFYALIMMFIFYISSALNNLIIGFVCYCVACLVLTLIFYRSLIVRLYNKVFRR